MIEPAASDPEPHSDESWWAIVGPVARAIPSGVIATPHDRTAVLADAFVLGPVVLRPGGTLLREFQRSEPLTLEGITTVESYPILVEGRWSQEAAMHRQRDAANVLHRVGCLLSLAWGELWQVRTSATSTQLLPPRIPNSWEDPGLHEGFPGAFVDDDLPTHARELPRWTADTWAKLDSDNVVETALTFWHQGVHLSAEFPSFALVAFAASVEALSGCDAFRERVDIAADACPECGAIPRASARFWGTLQLAASDDELARLKREWNVYSRRSDVAHGARTHGFETVYGSIFLFDFQAASTYPSVDERDPVQFFVLHALPRLTALTSRLLREALGGPPHIAPTPSTARDG
jgi:hypothetical protein